MTVPEATTTPRKEPTMTPTRFTYPTRDGRDVTAYRWDPAGEPVAAAQLTHGMGEHVLRYQELAQALTDAGIVVYGQDHRGHGASADSDADLGQLGANGWELLVDDLGRLTSHVHDEHPGLPLILIAHSMGSFAAQQYLLDHSDQVAAVALTGTAALDLLEPALDLDQPLVLAMFNAPFQPARTDFDWLSRDETEVDRYVAARRLADPDQVARMRSDLPVYVAVGEADPVNAGLALLHPLVDRYRAAGLTDVTVHTYPEARHEVLNETNREQVVADLLAWIHRVLKDG